MNKEDVKIIAQLLSGMKNSALKLEEAYKKKDFEELNNAKKEIIYFQSKIEELL